MNMVNCWLEADVLSVEAAAEVRSIIHRAQPLTENDHQDVSELVAMMANTALVGEVDGVSEGARAYAHSRLAESRG